MTSHNSLPYATPTCDSYGRTDGRTNEESWLRTRDHLASVTRAHTYDDSHLADCLEEAALALGAARTRLGAPRVGEQREPIHPWLRRAIYWRDGNRCGWCFKGFDDGMLVLDHIKPWADGGTDRSDNLRTLCEPCNDDRSNYSTDSYTRVVAVGMCDHCYIRPRWDAEGRVVCHELDVESEFRQSVFCGRCGRVDITTDERRVL